MSPARGMPGNIHGCRRKIQDSEGVSRIPIPQRKPKRVKAVEECCFQVSSQLLGLARADMGKDEEREAMVMQMKDECRSISSNLDLDRVLRELEDRVSGSEFSNIGPFGILPLNNSQTKIESPDDAQDVELIARISTPEMNLSLSQFSWGDIDDLQTWDALETESAAALINLRFTPDKDLYNADTPSQWLLPRPASVAQLDAQSNAQEIESELVRILANSKGISTFQARYSTNLK
jgi:hypothetical protein